ncbi:MAG: GNAT family N-acetyltransferase [Sphingomonas sp.]|nr:GNAT family N-acetyltransferase [Sphingomonas sp.]
MTLRPGWPEDAPALTAAIAYPEVAFRLARLPWPYTVDHAAEWLAQVSRPDEVSRLILAHDGGHTRLVGGIGIHPDGDAHEFGYWLTPDAWGRGYATEAGRAMLGLARYAMGLKRLTSGHFIDNPASGRVLAKLGFRPTGIAMRHCLAQGGDKPCATSELSLAEEESTGTVDGKPTDAGGPRLAA